MASTEYTDAETGFVYLRPRYYDLATGQFISRDPLTAMTGAPYSYAGGNPLNETDPSGLCVGPRRLCDAVGAAWDATAGKAVSIVSENSAQIGRYASWVAAVLTTGALVCSAILAVTVVGEGPPLRKLAPTDK